MIMSITAVVNFVTSWRTDGNNCLEQLYGGVGCTQSICGLTNILLILILFYGHCSENGVHMLVVIDKMSNSEMLICCEWIRFSQHVPLDGRRWIGLYLTLQVHVKLEGLTQPLPWNLDGWRMFHLHVNVPPGPSAHHVGGHAVVGAPVPPLHLVNDQLVALEDKAAGGQQLVVLPSPVNDGVGVAGGVTPEDDPVALPGDDRSGGVVGDDRRSSDNQRNFSINLVSESHQHLTLVLGSVSLLNIGDAEGVGRGGAVQVNVESGVLEDECGAHGNGEVVVPINIVHLHPDDGVVASVLNCALHLDISANIRHNLGLSDEGDGGPPVLAVHLHHHHHHGHK